MKNKIYPDNIRFPDNIKQWLALLKNDISLQRYALSACSETLIKAYQQAVNLNALSILVPEEMSGVNLELTAQYYYHKNMAMASGALAFLCVQHIGAMGIIAHGNNAALKEAYLTQNHQGRYTLGIAISQF